jgi:hypothetical protein
MKMLAESSLKLSFGIADGTAPIVGMTNPVNSKAPVHGQDCMNVTVAEDSLQ